MERVKASLPNVAPNLLSSLRPVSAKASPGSRCLGPPKLCEGGKQGPIITGLNFVKAGVTAWHNHERLWLWAPAFAGAPRTYDLTNPSKNPVRSSVT
jgi:hypothetical protein